MEIIMAKIINFIKLVKNYFVFSFLAVIFLATSWSLLRPGFFRVHDYIHGARIAEMTRAISDGHFPVRWSENFGYGLGMPMFEFYAPLPFYVGSFFYWLGIDLITSVKIIFIIANLGTVIGSFKLGKELFGNRSGILLSAAFSLAPYRAVNLFVRGALAEAWGMMSLPWILLGIVWLIKGGEKQKQGLLTLSVGLTVLMLSHNLTTLMFVPFSFLFALILLISEKYLQKEKIEMSFKKLSIIIGGYLLAGGLSSFYMIPAFLEKQYTHISQMILGGYFHYSNHFLYIRQFFYPNWAYGGSSWGPDDDISFFVGYGQLFAMVIALFGLFYLIKERKLLKNSLEKNRYLYLIPSLFILTGLSLFMTLLKSKFIWDNLPLLEFIQFPWRFLSVSIIFIAMLVAVSMKMVRNIVIKLFYFLIVFWVIILGNFYFFRPEKIGEDPTQYYYADEDKIRTAMSDVLKDYVPQQMSLDGNDNKKIFSEFVLNENLSLQIDKTHQKLYTSNLSEETIVSFPISFYPGWKVEIDGKEKEVNVAENGLISVSVPKGQHQIGLIFGNTPIRQVADTISLVSFLILLYLIIDFKKEKKPSFFKRIF